MADIPVETFNNAVAHAREIIKDSMSKDRADVHTALSLLTDSNYHHKQPVNREDVRLSYYDVDDGKYYRIKLYEDDGEESDGRLCEHYIHDSHGASNNRKLIYSAQHDAQLFDDLRDQIAYELEQDYKISSLFISFIASILRQDITRPKSGRAANTVYRYGLISAMDMVLLLYGDRLKLTRNDATKNQVSVLDAVSIAAKSLGYKCEYSTLKRDFYPHSSINGVMKKYSLEFPDDEDPYKSIRPMRKSWEELVKIKNSKN